jgi:predicted MFS family arabinose efflux permease
VNSDRSPSGLSGLGAVALVALGAAVAQAFGRFSYGVLLPAIRDDLNVSNTIAGSIGTVNVGAYLLGSVLVALATSRLRLLTVLKGGLMISTTGLLGAALADGPVTLGVALFLTGLGGAAVWIPSPVVAADAIAPERRRLAIALMGSGIGLGIVFTGQLSSLVRANQGDEGWRWVYAIEAGIAVATLTLVLLTLDHRQDRPQAGGAGIGGFSTLRRMRGWVPLTFAYTSFGIMYLLVVAFLTAKLENDDGWTSGSASLTFTTLGIAVVFGGPLFIKIAEGGGARRGLMVGFGLWACLVVVTIPGWTVPTFLAAAGIGAAFAGIPGLVTVYVVEHTTTEDYGPSYAAATLSFGIAQMFAPQLGGAIADAAGSFTLVFVLSALCAVVGLAASARLPD